MTRLGSQLPTNRITACMVLAAVLVAPAVAAPDDIRITDSDPPKSFRFNRGADPVQIAITIRYRVEGAEGDEIAFGVHDQKDRALMMGPMPIAKVERGQDSIIFKARIKTLDPEVKSVVVEAVLLKARRRGGQPPRGQSWNAKLTYKVE